MSGPLGFPGQSGGLRIGVDDEDVLTSVSEAGGEVDRDGGLADATLLVGYGDDHVGSCIGCLKAGKQAM